jgi:hypothetical protein
VFGALVLGLAAATSPATEVSPVPLGDLALYADAIVIGRVARVVGVSPRGVEVLASQASDPPRAPDDRWTIAEVDVERVIKGDPLAKKVWYLAQPTWICDDSKAFPGERGLFFLIQTQTTKPEARRVIDELTAGQPILRDAWSGSGRMPIRTKEGTEWLVASDIAVPPEGLKHGPAVHEAYQEIYWTAHLNDVVGAIEAALATRRLILPAHPISGLPAELAIVVDGQFVVAAHWRDGTTIWSHDLVAGGPPYLRASSRAFEDLYRWTSGRELGPESWQKDTFPPHSRTRVTVRLPLETHDLGCPTPAAEDLRAEILRRLPREGEPFDGDGLPLR